MDYQAIVKRLGGVANLSHFADQSGIPRRTLQRLRQQATNPSVAMLDRVVAALRDYRPKKK